MKTIYKVLIGLAFLISTSQANADPFGAFGGSGATDVDTLDLTSITLEVLETGTITDLNLYIQTNIPPISIYADELDIYLSHGGITVLIYDGIGSTQNSFINATFNDDAPAILPPNGTVLGDFRPVELLASFNGVELSGTWTLQIQDLIVPNNETDLVFWSIEGEYTPGVTPEVPVPEPATMLLLGLGLVGLAGARRKFRK